MKCAMCGAAESDDGSPRVHALLPTGDPCPFSDAIGKAMDQACEVPPLEPAQAPAPAEPARPPMRVMQFVVNVELTPEGEPLRVTVLISGGLASTFELGEDAELSIGDAVDLALTRAGRRLLSVDVR